MNGIDLEFEEIQGNVLAGFNTNIEVFIGLTAEPGKTRENAEWLASLAPHVTTVADIRELRQAMKPAAIGGYGAQITWLNLGIASTLLGSIREDLFVRDEAFTRGFRKRAPTALGDRTDFKTWRVGGASSLDALLIVASNDEAAAAQRAAELISAAESAGFACTYRETARRIRDLEHFGFRDGVSQPLVRGCHAGGTVGPGYFVFGYERERGEDVYLPAIDPSNFLRNGSFMVFRRLSQDVEIFRSFCRAKAAELGATVPGLSGPHLEALLVGRWPSGALASVDIGSDPGPDPNENAFDFSDDPSGYACPYGAHIRKVNPRAGPKDVVDIPRILRRGIPFGPPFDQDPSAERGLAFVSFQTSIRDQLEFLTSGWMNSPSRPAAAAGHDLLVGRSTRPRLMKIRRPHGEIDVSDDGAQWIIPTGGGYLFTPSRSALSRLLEPVAEGVKWRAEKLIAISIDKVHETLAMLAPSRG
jgi:Dyp-type peroxidase family